MSEQINIFCVHSSHDIILEIHLESLLMCNRYNFLVSVCLIWVHFIPRGKTWVPCVIQMKMHVFYLKSCLLTNREHQIWWQHPRKLIIKRGYTSSIPFVRRPAKKSWCFIMRKSLNMNKHDYQYFFNYQENYQKHSWLDYWIAACCERFYAIGKERSSKGMEWPRKRRIQCK